MGKAMFNIGGIVFVASAVSLLWSAARAASEAEFWSKLVLHILLFAIAFALCTFGDNQIRTEYDKKRDEAPYKSPELW